MSATPTQTVDDRLEKLREALSRKGDALKRCLRRAAEGGEIDVMEAVHTELNSVLSIAEFPADLRREIREAIEPMMLNAYTRAVEVALFAADGRGREGDVKGRNDNLTTAKGLFVKALRLGAGDDFRSAVEKRVQACLMTSTGVDEKTKAVAARKLEDRERAPTTVANGKERRRAVRYVVPPLSVEIDGEVFETIDWSQVGLSIRGWKGKPALKKGDKIRVGLSCAGLAASDRQLARVARVGMGDRGVAIEFPDISTIVLDLIQQMRRIGFAPRW